jgi:hypothetical protein
MKRLAALEAEVKADADAAAARKAAAVSKLQDSRAQRVTKSAAEPKPSQSQALVRFRTPRATEEPAVRADPLEDLGGALELASKANRVKNELTRAPKKGDKSWVKSGVASLVLGPIGWLYAGSMREAVPASVGWIALAALASKILPAALLTPILMLVLPLSAVAGVVYALQYNRSGKRGRLFDRDKDDKAKKQLRASDER